MGVAMGQWNLVLLSSRHRFRFESIFGRNPLRSNGVSLVLPLHSPFRSFAVGWSLTVPA